MASKRRPTPENPRTGTREKPLTGPPGCRKRIFAEALRALRHSIGTPTYRRLAAKASVSASALSKAADGTRQPTWSVTQAYVNACCGDVSHFKHLYRSLFGNLR